MKEVSFLDTGLLPTRFGYPAHFGPHALLPDPEFCIVWRFLRCNQCSFRHLYHKFVLREKLDAVARGTNHIAQPLHSLTRAIKTVLHGLTLNRQFTPQLILKSSGHHALRSTPSDWSFTTVLEASFQLQRKFIVCPSHGRTLFAFLYCDDDNKTASEIGGSQSLRTQLIPRGHSQFFHSSFGHNKNDQLTDVEHVRTHSVHFLTVAAQGFVGTTLESSTYCGLSLCSHPTDSTTDSAKTVSSRLIEINNRWNAAYQGCECKPGLPNNSSSRPSSVHFPISGVVSKVHNLITYATALKLERRNRTWELEAQHRVFDRYRQLLSEGRDPSAASELSQTEIDDEEDESTAVSKSDSVACLPLSSSHVERRRKKRRKRRRKCPSGNNETSYVEQKANDSFASIEAASVLVCSYHQSSGTQLKLHV